MLTPTEFLTGFFSLIIVIIFIVVGILTALKYLNIKNNTYIWWGVGLLGQGLPWMGSGISFLMMVLTEEGLSARPYFFMSLFWMAITLFFWMWTITELKFKEKQKIILLGYAVIGIIFETYFSYYLIIEPSAIGELYTPPLDSVYHGFTLIFTLFVLASISISLFLFIKASLKLKNPEINLRAKFLTVAMLSFIFGSIADAFITLNIVTVVVIRMILIFSALEFYIGWNLPKSLKNLFLKNE